MELADLDSYAPAEGSRQALQTNEPMLGRNNCTVPRMMCKTTLRRNGTGLTHNSPAHQLVVGRREKRPIRVPVGLYGHLGTLQRNTRPCISLPNALHQIPLPGYGSPQGMSSQQARCLSLVTHWYVCTTHCVDAHSGMLAF